MNRVFALILGAFFLAGFNAMTVRSAGDAITVNASLPEVPEETYTLKVVDQKISKERAQQIAERLFGIRGEALDMGRAWVIKNNSREVTVYKYGALKYLDVPEIWDSRYATDEMPGEANAKMVARGFIHRLVDEGLLQREMIPKTLEIERDTEVIAYKNGTVESYVLNVHVNAPLFYNGTLLHGAGAKLRVYLTKGGKVAGLLSFVGRLEPDKKVAVLSPGEAMEKLKSMGYENARIESVEFVYHVAPPGEMPTSIIPAYVFKGTLTKDGNTLRFVQVIPAVKNQ
jgi:hypothetical protein